MKTILFMTILLIGLLIQSCKIKPNAKSSVEGALGDEATLPQNISILCNGNTLDPDHVSSPAEDSIAACDNKSEVQVTLRVKWKKGTCSELQAGTPSSAEGRVFKTQSLAGPTVKLQVSTKTLEYVDGATSIPFDKYCLIALIALNPDATTIYTGDPIMFLDVDYITNKEENLNLAGIVFNSAVARQYTSAGGGTNNRLPGAWVEASNNQMNLWDDN